jgi:hypothetical protein
MRTFTDPYIAAKNTAGSAPIVLVELVFPDQTYYLSERDFSFNGRLYAGRIISTGGLEQYPDVAALGQTTLVLDNSDNWLSRQFAAYPPENRLVRIYFTFAGLTADDLPDPWVGVIAAPIICEQGRIQFDAVERSYAFPKQIGEVINTTDYADADPAEMGRCIPIVYGSLSNLRGRLIKTAWHSPLYGSITDDDTTLTVNDASRFPSSGTVQIDDEEITYSGKSTNTLTGLGRGTNGTAAADHTHGTDVVVKTTEIYAFAAHECNAIGNLKGDGQPLSGESVNLNDTTSFPGKTLATVTFPTKPRVDVVESAPVRMQIEMEADNGSSALNPTYACGLHGDYTNTNHATVKQAAAELKVKRNSAAGGIGEILRAWIACEYAESKLRPADTIALHYSTGSPTKNLDKPATDDIVAGQTHLHDQNVMSASLFAQFVQKLAEGGSACQLTNEANAGDQHLSTYARFTYTGTYQYLRITWPDPVAIGSGGLSVKRVRMKIYHVESVDVFALRMKLTIGGSSRTYNVPYASSLATSVDGWWDITSLSQIIDNIAAWTLDVYPTNGEGAYSCDVYEAWIEVEYQPNTVQNTDPGATSYTRHVTDYLDISSLVAGDWAWFTGKTAHVLYSGSANGVECYVFRVWFEVEYRARRKQVAEAVTADIQGAKYAGALVNYAWDVVRHFCVTYLAIPVDDWLEYSDWQADFWATTYYWFIQGIVDERVDPVAVLQGMLEESFSRLYWEGGKPRARMIPSSVSSTVKTISHSQIDGAIRVTRTAITDLVNEIILPYDRDWSQDTAVYKKTYRLADAASQTRYGVVQSRLLQCRWRRYSTYAIYRSVEKLAALMIARQKDVKRQFEFTTLLDCIELQRGDAITLDSPRDGINAVTAIVEQITFELGRLADGQPHRYRIVAREL